MQKPEDDTSARWWRDVSEVMLYLQKLVLILLGALIVASLVLACLSLMGITPWLYIYARFGPTEIPAAGAIIQILFTVFCATLLVFLPANARILRLEASHRQFNLNMRDVAIAYAEAHAADRDGAFTLSEEFASVRERLHHLRNHPDLGNLEPEILEISAQMSFLARDLAEVYSDDNVTRARSFLTQRQEEAARYADTLGAASKTCDELKRWVADVEAEESEIKKQVERLDADLQELLPKIGYAFEFADSTVVPMSKKPKASASRRA